MDWSKDDLWQGNYGKGPLMAEILSVHNGTATMRRWTETGRKQTRHRIFKLNIDALLNEKTGWRKVQKCTTLKSLL